jgi:hypothetical protein
VQDSTAEIDLLPTQGDQFGRAQPVPEGDKHHGRVPMAVPIFSGRVHQRVYLLRG